MDKEQNQTHPEVGEDATQYGEFVSTYFAWIPLPKQKEKSEEMARMTKRNKIEPESNAQNVQNRTGTKCPKEEK